MAALLAVVAMLATSALWPTEAAKAKSELQWKSKMVNMTVTHEATFDILVKGYDDSGDLHGTLKIGLFGEKVPMTVFNFVELCNGSKRPGGDLKFSNSVCHKLIPDMHFQCGDITTGDGSGGASAFGQTFRDENFEVGHSERGTVSMANKGPDSNGSQFFIVFRRIRSLDGKHVAFGQIVDKASLEFLDKLNEINSESPTFKPSKTIRLMDCTAHKLKKPLSITRTANAKQDRFQ
ncbi:hypothetical protein ACOMHN_012265 [Nucella lapillus]